MIAWQTPIKRVVFVSTYPPRQCGIGTFSNDLLKSLQLLLPNIQFLVYALNQSELDTHAYPVEVIQEIDQDDRDSYIHAAQIINRHAKETLIIMQHEYGIYGGPWGEYIVDFLKTVRSPVITTFHTVLPQPSLSMHRVTQAIIENSHKLVVLTDASFRLVEELYPAAQTKLVRLAHGIHPQVFAKPNQVKRKFKLTGRRVLLTFGLLGPSKGIEYVIRAMKSVVKKFPETLYLVVGGTHPNILRHHGESYRLKLMRLVKELGLQKHVRFVNNFLPTDVILRYLQAADVYIASSLNQEQAVSGTLSYALGAGRAVVATNFTQAEEAVQPKVGRRVPIGDSRALAQAVIALFGTRQTLPAMHRAAYASTRSMLWSNVADNYAEVAAQLTLRLDRWPEFKLDHLLTLTDRYGLMQFATATAPLRTSGYTLDDNARALHLVSDVVELYPEHTHLCNQLARRYLRVIEICLAHKPPVNYLTASTRRPTLQNLSEDLNDSRARAYQALQAAAKGSLKLRDSAAKLLGSVPNQLHERQTLRTTAFRLLGVCSAYEGGRPELDSELARLATRLTRAFEQTALSDWAWFEPSLTYANGSLSASLIEAARVTGNKKYRKVGLQSLDWLTSIGFMGEVYVPIGQAGWYSRGGVRTMFDQQPEDVFAMTQALVGAYKLTSDPKYRKLLKKAFSWFLGNNLLGVRLYDDASGGCHDGLTPNGANVNEGAESTLAYLKARLLIDQVTT